MTTTRRFGARYGRKPRAKLSAIEALHKGRHKCPYCNRIAVSRLAAGIFQCRKCSTKFAGKAYTF